MNSKELPTDRLATTDKKGNRIYLYPADVKGHFRSLRSQVSAILILVFLTLPWIKIQGNPAILLDIPNRRFSILGFIFWAHDAPILFFVFGGGAILLAFVTAIWGRVWCGWACPQTVFVDGVFRRIERWIEGDAVNRRRLDSEPANWNKFKKKAFKWTLFSLFSLLISHSFLAYFVGTVTVSQMMRSSPLENPTSFLVMAGVTLAILFDFGWFREQFCTIVCPYGRFQSVLMDQHSQAIIYDTQRGEPRKGTGLPSQAPGDCVNCYRCVQVCPTGIDIRRGIQMECIACTACMDACDEVMSRLKKDRGLIRYDSLSNTLNIDGSHGTRGARDIHTHDTRTDSTHEGYQKPFQRPRVWAYILLISVCSIGLALALLTRTPLEIMVIRATGEPYQELQNATGQSQIVNHFKIDLRNQTLYSQSILFSISDLSAANPAIDLVVSNHSAQLEGGASERLDIFIKFPKSILSLGKANIMLNIDSHSQQLSPIHQVQELNLVGPLR